MRERVSTTVALVASLIALVLVAGLGPAAPVAAQTTTAAERASAAGRYAHSAFRATNHRRDQNGRRELRHQKCVQKYAVKNARRMARREVMEHQPLEPIARDCGLSSVGENIAYGYPTGRAVVRGWMHSPPHRRNILNRGYRLLGLAARKGDDGRWYAAQVFGAR